PTRISTLSLHDALPIYIMKVGMSLNMLTKEGRTDASVVGEHLALGDLAEPLGFDSVFALEHHFTGYAMSPSPTQLLSYIAGRTQDRKSTRLNSSHVSIS